MIEHFSESARRVIVVAKEEAELLGHDRLGTGHLLLGLLVVDDDGFTANLLWGCDLTVDLVRTKVAELADRRAVPAPAEREFTELAKRSFEHALRAAGGEGRQVGPDHLLLGAIELGEGVAVQVLDALGVDLVHLRAAVLGAQRMATRPDPSP